MQTKTKTTLYKNGYKKLPGHPDFQGKLPITGQQVKDIIQMHKDNVDVYLSVAVWKYENPGKDPTLWLVANSDRTYRKDEKPKTENSGGDFSDVPF